MESVDNSILIHKIVSYSIWSIVGTNCSILVMCRFYYYISNTIHLLRRNTNFTIFVFDFISRFQFGDFKLLVEEPCLIIGLDCSQSIVISAKGYCYFMIVYFIRLLAAIFGTNLFNY